MNTDCIVLVDGVPVQVPLRANVVAALVIAQKLCTRTSVKGEQRFALCGMGHCQECRVTIDERPHQLACQTLCREGMNIKSGNSP